ncbi:hypothetical protein V1477_011149 [Vespula maculifrons]|uniref:Secreted protein n=1 Tax=Vespula maculifrons TaxID=7453 RepID=A0ABD2C429_VESMC
MIINKESFVMFAIITLGLETGTVRPGTIGVKCASIKKEFNYAWFCVKVNRSISIRPLPQIFRFFVKGIIPIKSPATMIHKPAIVKDISQESVISNNQPASGGPKRLPIP